MNSKFNKNNLLLAGLFFSGISAIVCEVVWTRATSLVIGSTTYAISTMLAAFMGGLALGGYLGGKFADKGKNNFFYFGIIEGLIGICSLGTFYLIKNLPPVYSYIYSLFDVSFYFFSFIQFLVAFSLMVVPTTLMGMTFPIVVKERIKTLDTVGRESGDVYSINSVGAIFGAILAGFVLIPLLGVKYTVIVAASINIMVAIVILVVSKTSKNKIFMSLFIISLLSFAILLTSMTTQKNVGFSYYTAKKYGNYEYYLKETEYADFDVLYAEEGPYGPVEVFYDKRNGRYSLATNGKFEGAITKVDNKVVPSSGSDWLNQMLLAYLPLESIGYSPKSFLSIGLGTGSTLKAASTDEGLSQIVNVEINPLVNSAVSQFFYPELFNDERIEHIETDARNYLSLVNAKYDIISSEPSYPVEEGLANMFTKEFFAIVKSRLNGGGIFTQWVPSYLFNQEEMDMMIRTLNSVFPYIYGWKLKSSDFIYICSLTPVEDLETIKDRIKNRPMVLGLEVDYNLVVNNDVVKKVKERGSSINSDNLPYVEFNSARRLLGFN